MTQNNPKPATPKSHPLMEPEQVKAIWRAAQERWRHDGEAMVRGIEVERDEWGRRIP